MGFDRLNPRRIITGGLRRVLGTITHVSTQKPVVALTFDDGPHPEFTPRLLEILQKHQAHATFFMVGGAAQRHPDIVRRVAEAGHAIGNHSWDHSSLPLLTGKERRAQIRACEKALAPYGQRLLRPPYGHQSVASRLDALWLGYQVITWNVTASDWQDRSANWITDRLVNEVRPGDIVLFHDALYTYVEKRYTDRGPTLQAVDLLLERLGERFRFVTVPELLRSGRPQRRNWYQKADVDWLNRLEGACGEPRRYAHSSGGG